MIKYFIKTDELKAIQSFYENFGFKSKPLDRGFILESSKSNSILVSELIAESEVNIIYLDESYIDIKPNKEIVYLNVNNIKELESKLGELEVPLTHQNNALYKKCKLKDPIRNNIMLSQEIEYSDEDLVVLYQEVGNQFLSLARNLNEDYMFIYSEITKWSMKNIIGHTIEIDIKNSEIIKYLIANLKKHYSSNDYNCNESLKIINYENYNLDYFIDLYESNRKHLYNVLEYHNYPMDNQILLNNNSQLTLRKLIKSLTSHMIEHIEEIKIYINE